MKRRTLLCACAAVTATLTATAAPAQQYPTKPVRMVIGFAPGGGTDIIGRIVAQKLAEGLGQPVLPDNRGGASGQLGAEIVAKAPPDGHTIMMAHIAAIAILPSLVPKLPYEPARDFAPVSLVAIGPNLLVVHPSLPVKTVKDLIAFGRARPGELQYATSGAGTIQHLAGELFKLHAKVDMLHVPYKGSGPALVDVMAGQVHMIFDSVPAVLPHVKSGRLRAVAVTSAKRFSLLPEIPTVSEGGLPGFDMNTWWGLVVPAGPGSAQVVTRLATETRKILAQRDVRERIAGVGAETVGSTPEEFAAYIRAERAKYAKVIKDANIKLE